MKIGELHNRKHPVVTSLSDYLAATQRAARLAMGATPVPIPHLPAQRSANKETLSVSPAMLADLRWEEFGLGEGTP